MPNFSSMTDKVLNLSLPLDVLTYFEAMPKVPVTKQEIEGVTISAISVLLVQLCMSDRSQS